MITGTRPSTVGRPSKIYVAPEFANELLVTARRQVRVRPESSEFEDRVRVEESVAERRRARTSNGRGLESEHERTIVEEQQDAALIAAMREVAPTLAREEPCDLILDFADWAVAYLKGRWRQALEDGRGHGDDVVRDLLTETATVRAHFRYYFGPSWSRDVEGKIFELDPVIYSSLDRADGSYIRPDIEQRLFVRRDLAERVLSSRIVGRRVLEIHDGALSSSSARLSTVATHAAMAPVRSDHDRRGVLGLVPSTGRAFAAAAARTLPLPLGSAVRVVHDVDRGPDTLGVFDEGWMAERGWAFLDRFERTIGDRGARLTALDLRQYRRDVDVLTNRIDWLFEPAADDVDVLIRDGDLAPKGLNWRAYVSPSSYGRLSRNAVWLFALACRLVLDYGGNVTYAAIGDTPSSRALAALVFRYCWNRKLVSQLDETAILRPALRDGRMVQILLDAFLSVERHDRPTFGTTFRILERFRDRFVPQALAWSRSRSSDDTMGRSDESDWMVLLDRWRHQPRSTRDDDVDCFGEGAGGSEGVPMSERDYHALRFLGERVGVLTGFALPRTWRGQDRASTRYWLPRLQVLVDLKDRSSQHHYERAVHAIELDEMRKEPDHLILPLVCHEARYWATEVSRRNARRIKEVLESARAALRSNDVVWTSDDNKVMIGQVKTAGRETLQGTESPTELHDDKSSLLALTGPQDTEHPQQS